MNTVSSEIKDIVRPVRNSESSAITSGSRSRSDYTSVYCSLQIIQVGPAGYTSSVPHNKCYGAKFSLQESAESLFPYINAVIKGAKLSTKPPFIKFMYREHLCVLNGHEGAFTPVTDYAEASAFLRQLLEFFQELDENSCKITPNHRVYRPASPLDILKLLPKSNCQDCGFATCLAFAAALSRQYTSPTGCPYLPKPLEERSVFQVTDKDGNCTGTVSLPIDTTDYLQKVSDKDAHIQELKMRLEELEYEHVGNVDMINSELVSPLTQREIEVLRMVASGATNKDIAADLYISEHTVKTHIVHIFNKLNVNDRTQASVWAAKNGLV